MAEKAVTVTKTIEINPHVANQVRTIIETTIPNVVIPATKLDILQEIAKNIREIGRENPIRKEQTQNIREIMMIEGKEIAVVVQIGTAGIMLENTVMIVQIDTAISVGIVATVTVDTEINTETEATVRIDTEIETIAPTDIEINVEIEVTVVQETTDHPLQEGETIDITIVVLAEIGSIDETRPIDLMRIGDTIIKKIQLGETNTSKITIEDIEMRDIRKEIIEIGNTQKEEMNIHDIRKEGITVQRENIQIVITIRNGIINTITIIGKVGKLVIGSQ